jgi:hypothetical protein
LLTRNSKYINVPAGENLLDGTERAKFLKNRRLRFGDVDEDFRNVIGGREITV